MPVRIALLRGVNVGGRNALRMKELVGLLEALDLNDVRTYLQSGNVVFRSGTDPSAQLAAKISDSIEAHRGFRPHVLLMSGQKLRQAIASNPFPEAESNPKSLHLFFLDAVPQRPRIDSLTAARAPSERFHLADDVFYLHAPDGIGRSKLAARVEKDLGVAATARNWRTVVNLMGMIDEA